MKKIGLFVLFLLPMLASAQYDFETRYFTIKATSLPEIEDLTTFSVETAPKFFAKVPTFKMNRENYRQPVNMGEAVLESQNYIESSLEIDLNSNYGFAKKGEYVSDGKTTVKNLVYQESRGLDLLSPCPPYGICARCAPFRINRGY